MRMPRSVRMAYVIFSRVSDAKTTSSGTEMPMIQPVVVMV